MTGRILVAGVGNVFLTDDGFGVAVVEQLARREVPPNVIVRDFGIRGIHLAYELLEPYDLVVLVDAMHRDGPPGTLYVVEPDTARDEDGPVSMDAHDLAPEAVLAMVPKLGGEVGRVIVVGCEPEDVSAGMSLTAAVAAAVPAAVELVLDQVGRTVSQGSTL